MTSATTTGAADAGPEAAEAEAAEAAPALLDGRIWVDGCFDFFHHGACSAMAGGRRLGRHMGRRDG